MGRGLFSHLTLWALLFLLVRPGLAEAILFDLTRSQISQAILHGKENRDTEYQDFIKEWIVSLPSSSDYAMIVTEFFAFSERAREATRQSRELRPEDFIEPLFFARGVERNLLRFLVGVEGDSEFFARDNRATLEYKRKTIHPLKQEASKTIKFVDPSQDEEKIRYHSRTFYDFPSAEIDLSATITLIVTDPSEGKESRFTFDLSHIR